MANPPITGWKKDVFDIRDYPHKIGVAPIPRVVDLSNRLAPVRNQASMNSCVGHGLRVNLWAAAKQLGISFEDYSTQWIWNGARFKEGTLAQNVGVYPRDACDWVVEMGALFEKFWPYSPALLDMAAPSSERQAQAIKYPNLAYYRVADGVDGIMSALAEGHMVSIGAPWPDSKWNSTDNQGVLPPVTVDDFSGSGHEVCIYKGDQDAGLFWAENSWGTDWGLRGLFAFRFEFIDLWKKLGGYDATYFSFNAPAPSPSPSPCKVGNGIASLLNIYSRLAKRQGRFYYMNK